MVSLDQGEKTCTKHERREKVIQQEEGQGE